MVPPHPSPAPAGEASAPSSPSQRAGLTHDRGDIGDLLLGGDSLAHSRLQLVVLPCEPPGIGTLAKSGRFRGLSCSLGALQQVPGPLDAPRQHRGHLDGKSHVVQRIFREQRLG